MKVKVLYTDLCLTLGLICGMEEVRYGKAEDVA